MALPKMIKNGTAVFDGVPMGADVENITLPKLTMKTDDYRGGGMLGPVKVDLGMEGIQVEFECAASFRKDLYANFGGSDASGVGARFIFAVQSDDDRTETDAVELSVRGRLTEVDPGSWKPDGRSKTKVVMPLTYACYRVNNQLLREVDLISGVNKGPDGIDFGANILRALGFFTS